MFIFHPASIGSSLPDSKLWARCWVGGQWQEPTETLTPETLKQEDEETAEGETGTRLDRSGFSPSSFCLPDVAWRTAICSGECAEPLDGGHGIILTCGPTVPLDGGRGIILTYGLTFPVTSGLPALVSSWSESVCSLPFSHDSEKASCYREEGFLPAHSSRAQSIVAGKAEWACEASGLHSREREGERDKGRYSVSFLLFWPGLQHREWCCPRPPHLNLKPPWKLPHWNTQRCLLGDSELSHVGHEDESLWCGRRASQLLVQSGSESCVICFLYCTDMEGCVWM